MSRVKAFTLVLLLALLVPNEAWPGSQTLIKGDVLQASTSGRIGTTGSPASSAVLDLVSTTLGLLPPRMTTAQRDLISSPATGLACYNTSTNFPNFYDGTAWRELVTTAGGQTITGTLSGNASTATALAANPTDCGANTYATTIAASGNLTCASITNASTTATDANTASTIVARDGSGNFSAGTITAALSGNASTSTALASNPSDCAANRYATTIAANGDLTCAQVSLTAGVTGTLPEGNGGTNQSTYSQGDILYASASNTLSKLAKGTAGQLLSIGSTVPAWAFPGYASKSANYTAVSSDDTILFTADATLSLPAASGVTGKVFHVVSSGTGTDVTIDPNSTETVCGQTTISINGDGDGIDIQSDGSNWRGLNYGCQRTMQVYGNAGSTSILAQQGNAVASISNPGTGRSGVTFTTGVWSAAPYCTCTGAENAASNQVCDFAAVPTTSTVEVRTRTGSTGTLTADDWHMVCRGAR